MLLKVTIRNLSDKSQYLRVLRSQSYAIWFCPSCEYFIAIIFIRLPIYWTSWSCNWSNSFFWYIFFFIFSYFYSRNIIYFLNSALSALFIAQLSMLFLLFLTHDSFYAWFNCFSNMVLPIKFISILVKNYIIMLYKWLRLLHFICPTFAFM